MSLVKPRQKTALYERDFHEWIVAQTEALREERWSDLDWENLAEEIESAGRRDKQAVLAHLEILLAHLLKCLVQPERWTRSWELTIREQRKQIDLLIRRNPSLRHLPHSSFSEAYIGGVRYAARDTGLQDSKFPTEPPFTVEEALDQDFLPLGRLGK